MEGRVMRVAGAPLKAHPLEAEDLWRRDVERAMGPVAAYVVGLLTVGIAAGVAVDGGEWQSALLLAVNAGTVAAILGDARVALPNARWGLGAAALLTWALLVWRAVDVAAHGVGAWWHPVRAYTLAMELGLALILTGVLLRSMCRGA